MKKYLLSILFAMFGIVTYAQTEPAITLTVEIDGNARNLVFAMTETGHKLQIDWGDGKLVETEEIADYYRNRYAHRGRYHQNLWQRHHCIRLRLTPGGSTCNSH